jgi:hypothetical protein
MNAYFDANFGEEVVFDGGVDEGGTRSEESDIESPKIFQRGAEGEKTIQRDKRISPH